MKNKILGIVGIIWGGLILLRCIVSDSAGESGAYQTGQTMGVVLGAGLFLAGCYALVKKHKKP